MQYNNQIQLLKDTDQYRYLKDVKHIGNGYVEYKGRKLLNLSSNDYIGISQNKELSSEFISKLNTDSEYLFGSASSRLLSGNYNEYTELENSIAKAYGKETALIYNSGYHANTGVLPALTTKKDLILSDKLNHASIVDGLNKSKLAGINSSVMIINGMGGVERTAQHAINSAKILNETQPRYASTLVLTAYKSMEYLIGRLDGNFTELDSWALIKEM